jgi:uncharacterized protein
MSYIDVPLHFDGRGRTRTAGRDRHVRNLIRQVLLTSPGERVNRPDFGCGLRELVFAPNSEALATAVQFRVEAALQRWLAEAIKVHDVRVVRRDAALEITVVYTRLELAERTRDVMTVAVGGQ